MGRQATYGNYVLTTELDASIGMEVFRATADNYKEMLRALGHRPIEGREGLRRVCVLLFELFERSIIVSCSISYSHKLELMLSNRKVAGNGQLLVEGALRQFMEAFNELTRQTIDVSWLDGGEELQRHRGGRDTGLVVATIANVFANIIDMTMDAIVFAAGMKELFGE